MSVASGTVAVRPVRTRALRRLVSGAGVVIVLAAWEIAGRAGVSPYLPPFTTAFGQAWDMVTGPQLTADVLPSIGRAVAGLAIGSVLGAVCGVALGMGGLRAWLRPILEFQRSLPIVAIAPVALIAFAPDSATRIGIIALASFWPVFVNAEAGAHAVDPRWVEVARAYGYGPAGIFGRVVFPGALPMILAGIRIATSVSLLAMVVSEFFLATSGLGYQLQYDARSYDSAGMWGAVIILSVLGRLMILLFNLAERRALRWYAGQKGLES